MSGVDGSIQALERKIEKRLSIIEKRQDDLDLVVVDQAAMSFRLKDERDEARGAAQVQADEIARSDERYHTLFKVNEQLHAEIARLKAELQRAHEAGERVKAELHEQRLLAKAYCDGAFLNAGERDAARADLAAAVKRGDELQAEVEARDQWHERLMEPLCETLGIEDAEDIDGTVVAVVKLRVEELAATTAKIASIVTAVEKNFIAEPSEYRDADGDGVEFGPVTFVCQHCGMHGVTTTTIDHERTCSYVEIKKALGADSAVAGDAYKTLMDTAGELQKRGYLECIVTPACGQCTQCRFANALARVDARRAGSK